MSERGPKRLFMTADAVGGVWRYALDLAAGLAEHGVETTVAVTGPAPSDDQAGEAAGVPGLTVLATGLPMDWTAESPAAVVAAGRELARLARRERAEVVQLNGPAYAVAGFDAPVAGVTHSCLATWWAAVRGGPLPADFAWRIEQLGRAYRAVDVLVAPSAAFAAATAEAYGIAAPLVVHNGRRACATQEAGEEPAGYVFTAGRLWDKGKNLGLLDRAAARLRAPVLAAGPLEGPNGARAAVRNAEALGRLSEAELAGRFAERPVFVSASLYEPFGLAVLEAAQAGCALVLSDIPTFRELWDGAAEFFDPRDEDSLVRAVERAWEPGRRTALGEAARERAGRYTVERMAAGMLRVYAAARTREAAA